MSIGNRVQSDGSGYKMLYQNELARYTALRRERKERRNYKFRKRKLNIEKETESETGRGGCGIKMVEPLGR